MKNFYKGYLLHMEEFDSFIQVLSKVQILGSVFVVIKFFL